MDESNRLVYVVDDGELTILHADIAMKNNFTKHSPDSLRAHGECGVTTQRTLNE